MKKPSYYYQAAVKAPISKLLSYQSDQKIDKGQKVLVPLGKKQVSAVIFGEDPHGDKQAYLKDILQLDTSIPPLSSFRLDWISWLSRYYHYPIGLVADLNFPPLAFKEKKESKSKTSLEDSKAEKDSKTQATLEAPKEKETSVILNPEQQKCFESVLKDSGFQAHLLYGVTGSGKTEVYKKWAAEILKNKKQVLILVPEIFLTPQLVDRFSQAFPNDIATLHSQLSPRQRTQTWEQVIKKQKSILIGTRSALFCPMPDLAMIIIDEEHDNSFKQEDKFRYQARDSAVVLAQKLDIPIVLGSASPSLTSWHQAQKKIYKLHYLKERAFQQDLPKVQIVDLKKSLSKTKPYWLTDQLFSKMQESLSQGNQVALFLNRRGLAHFLICFDCGHVLNCPNCDISLTLHKHSRLLCHYCAYTEAKPDHCSECNSDHWLEKGLGTASVEKTLQSYFPQYKIIRADRDSISSHKDMKAFVSVIQKKEAQIIIGTQMISKGLDFPSIDLVGLLMADTGFHLPDFKASERAFQTLLQMSGRSGRRGKGQVLLQTFNPEQSAFNFLLSHNYEAFVEEELKMREKLFYPPFSKLCLLEIDSLKESQGSAFALELAQIMRKKANPALVILGPSPAPLFKLKNRYRFHVLIKSPNHQGLYDFLLAFIKPLRTPSFIRLKVDRDPSSML